MILMNNYIWSFLPVFPDRGRTLFVTSESPYMILDRFLVISLLGFLTLYYARLKQFAIDSSLFIKQSGHSITVVLAYVYDIIVAGIIMLLLMDWKPSCTIIFTSKILVLWNVSWVLRLLVSQSIFCLKGNMHWTS